MAASLKGSFDLVRWENSTEVVRAGQFFAWSSVACHLCWGFDVKGVFSGATAGFLQAQARGARSVLINASS